MTANDLTAREIEARPAGEADYQLSLRIYDTAATNPGQMQALGRQLSSDAQTGQAGVNINYDNQGRLSAITINNEKLYDSANLNLPGQIATQEINGEIQRGDLNAAINEGRKISQTFGTISPAKVHGQVLDTFGKNLGALMKNPDLTAAHQYVSQMYSHAGPYTADLPRILDKARIDSGLGNHVAAQRDGRGGITSFRVNGTDLLQNLSQQPPAIESPQPVRPFEPAPAFSPAPPVEAVQPAKPKDAPLAPAAANPGDPPVNLFDARRSTIPADNAANPVRPASADKTMKPDTAENAKYQREIFEKLAAKAVDEHTRAEPVQKGEGYYQVVSRMHKDWSADHVLKEAHHLKDINHHSNVLRVGQKLSLVNEEQKMAAIKKEMDAFDKATPEQRHKMMIEMREQAGVPLRQHQRRERQVTTD